MLCYVVPPPTPTSYWNVTLLDVIHVMAHLVHKDTRFLNSKLTVTVVT